MQWIANLFNKVPGAEASEPSCVMRLEQDDVRMEIIEYPLPCGHLGYGVELRYRISSDNWVCFAMLRDFNLKASMDLLQQAQARIALWQDAQQDTARLQES